MKEYYCPVVRGLCKYGGNKRYNYGFSSGTASYCRKVGLFTHNLSCCPLLGIDVTPPPLEKDAPDMDFSLVHRTDG